MFPSPMPPRQPSNDHNDLRPDPVFMFLRRLIAGVPIGWVYARIEAWHDAREERRETAAAIAAASEIVLCSSVVSTLTEHHASDDLAA